MTLPTARNCNVRSIRENVMTIVRDLGKVKGCKVVRHVACVLSGDRRTQSLFCRDSPRKVTDTTQPFLPEAVRKRPQDSAGHHAVVHPISPSAGCDGGLPSGGHLFPPAGHLLELHQSNLQYITLSVHYTGLKNKCAYYATHKANVKNNEKSLREGEAGHARLTQPEQFPTGVNALGDMRFKLWDAKHPGTPRIHDSDLQRFRAGFNWEYYAGSRRGLNVKLPAVHFKYPGISVGVLSADPLRGAFKYPNVTQFGPPNDH
ncbi:hypothetical protein EAI_16038 [Harpegnathos saltator]|uniref:Uncharacterized protein n=1 Tax=Harpegnathos saltator TaxID=610380 RepID=E2C6K0_HARSA|nr:hypothetical protein EAI_16038 [Harpegnathos saltator]